MDLTDRFLFQKTHDFRQILNDLSSRVITILDIDKVGNAVLQTFQSALHLESGAILLKTEDGNKYEVLDAFGIEKEIAAFPPDDAFIVYFSGSDKTINLDLDDNVPDYVMRVLKDLKAVVVIPLFFQSMLIGLLALGRKKSDQEYSRQEMEYFPAISAQIAIALSNAREIELRKKNQAEYYQQTKLAAIGVMASGIAHELKNPLQIIRGCAGLVELGFKRDYYSTLPFKEVSAEVQEALKRVFDGIDRADKIVARLNHVSKKQTTQQLLPVEIAKPLDEVVDMVRHDFGIRGIEIETQEPDRVYTVVADYDLLVQIFLNLLTNARDAILQHPEARRKIIRVALGREGDEVRVSVSDSGIGIKSENMDMLFSPFFTTKDVTRNDDPNAVKGTGLGLHLVRQMVQDVKGHISVESEYLKGTTFNIFLPLEKESEAGG